MFGTEEAGRIIIRELGSVGAVTSVVSNRIRMLPVLPGDVDFPAVLITPLASDHHGPVNGTGDFSTEQVQIEVAFTTDKDSSSTIRSAAEAGMSALRGAQFSETIDGETWFVSISSLGGLPRTGFADGQDIYRQLGGTLLVEFSRA